MLLVMFFAQSLLAVVILFFGFFYRAMHNSAKRGIAIACRPSVRL